MDKLSVRGISALKFIMYTYNGHFVRYHLSSNSGTKIIHQLINFILKIIFDHHLIIHK